MQYDLDFFNEDYPLDLKKCKEIHDSFLEYKQISFKDKKIKNDSIESKLPLISLAASLLDSNLDSCEENRLICHRVCRGGDPRNGACCLIGCELAYFLCRFMNNKEKKL